MNSIFHRISVRKYEDRPVEKEKIMEILRAGMQAPSACNQQPWEFYVVTDKEKIQKLSKVTPYTGCAAGAPVVIVPVYHTEVHYSRFSVAGEVYYPCSKSILCRWKAWRREETSLLLQQKPAACEGERG